MQPPPPQQHNTTQHTKISCYTQFIWGLQQGERRAPLPPTPLSKRTDSQVLRIHQRVLLFFFFSLTKCLSLASTIPRLPQNFRKRFLVKSVPRYWLSSRSASLSNFFYLFIYFSCSVRVARWTRNSLNRTQRKRRLESRCVRFLSVDIFPVKQPQFELLHGHRQQGEVDGTS